jgi:hypothetical protein
MSPDLQSAERDDRGGLVLDGQLWFGEGSLRGLAAFMCLLSLLENMGDHSESLQDPNTYLLVKSLMRIHTMLDNRDVEQNARDSTLSRIIKQNQAAKTQPITSYQWVSILKSITPSGEDADIKGMIDAYAAHPEVIAVSGAPNDSDAAHGGVGSLSLHPRMFIMMKNWTDKTSPDSWAIVSSSNDDIPYSLGPFGEQWAANPHVFIGSTVKLAADPGCGLTHMFEESHITIDWSLPLTEPAQKLLFSRNRHHFNRVSGCVPIFKKKSCNLSSPSDNRRYP